MKYSNDAVIQAGCMVTELNYNFTPQGKLNFVLREFLIMYLHKSLHDIWDAKINKNTTETFDNMWSKYGSHNTDVIYPVDETKLVLDIKDKLIDITINIDEIYRHIDLWPSNMWNEVLRNDLSIWQNRDAVLQMMWTWRDALADFFTAIDFPSYESIYALNNKYDVSLYDVLLVETLGRYVFKTHENYDFVYFMTVQAGGVPDNYVKQFNVYSDNNTVTGFNNIVITPEIKKKAMSRGEYRIFLNYMPIWADKLIGPGSLDGLTLEQIGKMMDGQYVISRAVTTTASFLAGAVSLAFMGPTGWLGLFQTAGLISGTFGMGTQVNESIQKENAEQQASENAYKDTQENTPPPPPKNKGLIYALIGLASVYLMSN